MLGFHVILEDSWRQTPNERCPFSSTGMSFLEQTTRVIAEQTPTLIVISCDFIPGFAENAVMTSHLLFTNMEPDCGVLKDDSFKMALWLFPCQWTGG